MHTTTDTYQPQGHTAVISASHPEHIACSDASPWGHFAAQPPPGQLRLASPATTNFTVDLLLAVAKMLPSKLFSTGGDELNTNCYAVEPQTQADLKSSGKTLEQALNVLLGLLKMPSSLRGKPRLFGKVYHSNTTVKAISDHFDHIFQRWSWITPWLFTQTPLPCECLVIRHSPALIFLIYPGCGYRPVTLQKSLPEVIELYTHLPTISILYVASHVVVVLS